MQKKKWAIFLLIHTTGDDAKHIKNLISDILNAGINKKVNLHICLSTTNKGIFTIDPQVVTPDPNEDKNLTGYFYSITSADCLNNRLPRPHIQPSFDITRRKDLVRFFKTRDRKVCAEKIMVLTWDHGSAIGIFRQTLPGSEEVLDPKFERDYKMLTNKDLRIVFKKIFGRKKVDMLLMMNCFMNFFDFGFTLKKTVRFLIAPENFISNTGFNYSYIFKKLCIDPDVSPIRLSKIIVEKQNKIGPNRSDPALIPFFKSLIDENNRELILSANRLDVYNEFADRLDKVVVRLTYLIKKNRILIDKIIECKEKSAKISDGKLFNLADFGSLSIQLLKMDDAKEFRSNNKMLFKCLDKIVISKYLGTGTQAVYENAFLEKTAFSIYFPTVEVLTSLLTSSGFRDFIQETSPHATYFSKNHLWDNFLSLLLAKNKGSDPILHTALP